jgi:hypothetical protein
VTYWGEVLAKRLHNPALAEIFPHFAITQRGFVRG